jgi:hypothetical protein
MFMKTWRTGDTARRAGAVIAVAGASIAFGAPQVALAATSVAAPKGGKGTVRIHGADTSGDDRRNEPQVCAFYLAGYDFGGAQPVSWEISALPPPGAGKSGGPPGAGQSGGPPGKKEAADTVAARDTVTAAADGTVRTGVMRLRDGHYRLEWAAAGVPGKGGKHKTFTVECPGRGGRAERDRPPGGSGNAGEQNDQSARGSGGASGAGGGPGAPPAARPAAPPKPAPPASDAKGPVALNARTVAAAGTTGVGLVVLAAAGVLYLRRRGIGPFAPSGAAADGSTGAAETSGLGTLTGMFGPLVGTGDGPATVPQTPTGSPPPSGPPTPPQGPSGPSRPDR